MSAFVFYWVHLGIFVTGMFVGLVAARRRNAERALTMLVIVLVEIISLANGYYDWYWHLSGMLGITWAGN
jgi:hypothetical protein